MINSTCTVYLDTVDRLYIEVLDISFDGYETDPYCVQTDNHQYCAVKGGNKENWDISTTDGTTLTFTLDKMVTTAISARLWIRFTGK